VSPPVRGPGIDLAGWLAERFMNSNMGLLGNIVLGIIGGVVGNFLALPERSVHVTVHAVPLCRRRFAARA
jgi:hypothetical protein